MSDSLPKAGPSKQPDPIMTQTSISTTRASDHSDAQPMDMDHYGPLPPKSTQSIQSEHASRHSDLKSEHLAKSTLNRSRLRRQIARCNALVNKDKSDYYSKLISDNSHDSRKLWREPLYQTPVDTPA